MADAVESLAHQLLVNWKKPSRSSKAVVLKH